jgi:Ca-activated chloride channel family protein
MRRYLTALALAAGLASHAAADEAILVLDASGSMWGQVEGRTKVEIARDVVGTLLDTLPAERRLGLMAYGHHRRGDCGDIELVAPVGAERASMRDTVNRLNAFGMTPISESVRRAAVELRYTEQKATVILVSDGEETCSADPCAVGAALEEAGVDFTAHIIGFDIPTEAGRADLQCLADTTGGRFVLASNAAELSDALQAAVAEEPAPEPEPVVVTAQLTMQATELADGPVVGEGLAWTVTLAGGGDQIYASPDAGEGIASTELAPGIYDVAVVRSSDGLEAQGRARIEPGESETLTLALTPVFEATVATVSSAPAGSEVSVTWTGPIRERDYISTAGRGFNAHSYLYYAYVRNGSPLLVRLPDEPGEYEIRYILDRPTTVLATTTITATPLESTLEAADTAAAESPMAVSWTGPDYPGDYIATAPEDSRDDAYVTYSNTRNGSPLEIRAPSEPGRYELRYVLNQSRTVLARRSFEVVANAASIAVPESAPAGSMLEVDWSGPNYSGDYIATAAVGAPDSAYLTYTNTSQGDPLALQIPDAPGLYEVRYVLGQSREVIARASVEATAVAATLEAPATSPAGATITVAWTGPAYSSDYLTVTERGAADSAFLNYTTLSAGASPADLLLPDAPGEYEIRYVLNQSRTVLARIPITATPIEASLEAAESAAAGSEVAVTWSGPNYNSDYIAFAPAGSPDSVFLGYVDTRNGSPASVTAPSEPGDYEVRYVLGQSRTVLARRSVSVAEP